MTREEDSTQIQGYNLANKPQDYAPQKREEGYYWVRLGNEGPFIAEWAADLGWLFCGTSDDFEDKPIVIAGPLKAPKE